MAKYNLVEVMEMVGYAKTIAKGRKTAILNKLGMDGKNIFMAEEDVVRKVLAYIADGKGKFVEGAEELMANKKYKEATTEYVVKEKAKRKTVKEYKEEIEALKAEIEELKEALAEKENN